MYRPFIVLSTRVCSGILALSLPVFAAAPQLPLPIEQELVVFLNKVGPPMPMNSALTLAWPTPNPRPVLVARRSAGLDEPVDFVIGPDARFYVASAYGLPHGRVLCYEADGTPNARVNAELAQYAQQSGILHAGGVLFGPDNRLYVTDADGGAVFCYRLAQYFPASPGWYTLVTLSRPSFLAIRPPAAGAGAGNLLVNDFNVAKVKEVVLRTSAGFTGSNEGVVVGDFLDADAAGIANMLYGADGSLYVAYTDSSVVHRYDGLGATATFLAQIAPAPGNPEGLDSPQGLDIGPDGMLYVGSHGADRILRYRIPAAVGSPGIFDAVFASGLGDPGSIHFRSTGAAGSPFCEGSAIAAKCCQGAGGSPAQNHGCPNSVNAEGAQLFATLNQFHREEVRLSAWGLPGTPVCLFLQSKVSISPVLYGDGARCLGSPIKRIAAKAIVNGSASYPQAGDLDIRTRSAQIGDTIPTGDVRYYQGFYRENASPCGAGHTFSMTSGYSVIWP